jgi:hypothetical protein
MVSSWNWKLKVKAGHILILLTLRDKKSLRCLESEVICSKYYYNSFLLSFKVNL